jgi:sarcosine oxidase, subunit gamma
MTLALTDLSSIYRLGFKGGGTMDAMKKRGIILEAVPNRAYRQKDGGLCLVLGASEIILLGLSEKAAASIKTHEAEWRIDDLERSYPVPRLDGNCWFCIAGDKAADMMAKICGVDLRPQRFDNLQIAQTSVAKLNTIVLRNDEDGTLAFHLFADSASRDYLENCLRDAMDEFMPAPELGGQI